jgi:hypothetical protein
MSTHHVTYELLSDSRTDSSQGSGSSQFQNLTSVVSANSLNQAREMVEAINGDWAYCRAQSAIQID